MKTEESNMMPRTMNEATAAKKKAIEFIIKKILSKPTN